MISDQAIVLSEESNSDRESENDLEEHNTSLRITSNDDVVVDTTSHLLRSTQSEIANSSDLTTCDA